MARPREFDEERVLDAVMETFWRHGYDGTSAQGLVEATGIGRGSLYAAYVNKQSLFAQARLRYNNVSHANVETLRQSGSALECLRDLLLGVIDSDLGGPEKRGCLATNTAIERAGRDEDAARLVRQNFAIMISGIQEAIKKGQTTGEIARTKNADELALFVFNAMQGLRVLAKPASAADRERLTVIVNLTLQALV